MAALRKAWNPKLNFDDISWIIEKQITSMTNAHMYTFVVCSVIDIVDVGESLVR